MDPQPFTPVTNVVAPRRKLRIVDAVDAHEPFNLLDADGRVIDNGSDPRRLADYALEIADEVSHDYDIRKWEQRPPPVLRERGLDK